MHCSLFWNNVKICDSKKRKNYCKKERDIRIISHFKIYPLKIINLP